MSDSAAVTPSDWSSEGLRFQYERETGRKARLDGGVGAWMSSHYVAWLETLVQRQHTMMEAAAHELGTFLP